MKIKTAFIATVISALFWFLCSVASAETGFGRYDRIDTASSEAFRSTYGWNPESMKAGHWTGIDGKEYTRRSCGYQKEAFFDSIEALIAQLSGQGYLLDLTDGESDIGSTGSGKGIAEIALGEVGTERGQERPKGSNSVYYNNWYYGKSVYGDSFEWCGVFISWCASECGYLDSGLFLKTASCAEQYRHLTSSEGFSSYPMSECTICGGEYSPSVGDLCFWYSGGAFTHMGIISKSTNAALDITQGNCGDEVRTLTYTADSLRSSPGLSGGFIVHVEYPGFSFEGTGDLQDTVFLFLTKELGISKGGACGVLGNLQVECAWNLNAIGDSGTSYGLCQWHDDRWKALISFCNSQSLDASSAEGQLRYMAYELTNSPERAVLPRLTGAPDTEAGAKNAAIDFAKMFERCTPDSYALRQSYASAFWAVYGRR